MSSTIEYIAQTTEGLANSFSFIWSDYLDYNQKAVEFESSLKPFLIEEKRVSEWPGTTQDSVAATIRYYKWCPESVDLLKCVESPMEFLSPNYPEDLAVYNKDREVLYSSCAHETLEWF